MRSLLFAIWIIACLILVEANSSFAQTETEFQEKVPESIMAAYRDYAGATNSGDSAEVIKAASKAFKIAEKELGDHKFTGDLAYIVATLPVYNDYILTRRDRNHAFNRAIELATLHEGDGIDHLMKRHLSRIQFQMFATEYGLVQLHPGGDGRAFLAMERALNVHRQNDSIYAARFHTLYAQFHNLKKRPDEAVIEGEKALSLLSNLRKSNAKINKESLDPLLSLELGKAYEASGQVLSAALSYQRNIPTTAKGQNLTPKHILSIASFGRMKAVLKSKGELDSAYTQGLCKICGPDVKSPHTIPVMQIAPLMPPRAEHSGEVYIKFDLDNNGQVIEPQILASTDKLFHQNAMEAVSTWRYSFKSDAEDVAERRNRTARLVFEITDRKNRLKKGRRVKLRQKTYTLSDPIFEPDETVKAEAKRMKILAYR